MEDSLDSRSVEPHEELIEEAFQGLRGLMRTQQSISAPLWAELELSVAQLKALLVLASEGPAAIGQVADALGISLPTASHLVERLVQAGLAARAEDPRDRRRTLAHLTPPAEELTNRLFGCAQRVRAWLGELSEDDLRALAQGLRALLAVARA